MISLLFFYDYYYLLFCVHLFSFTTKYINIVRMLQVCSILLVDICQLMLILTFLQWSIFKNCLWLMVGIDVCVSVTAHVLTKPLCRCILNWSFLFWMETFCIYVTHDGFLESHGVKQHILLVSCRSPIESVSAGFLLLHSGDGGEAEPAEPHGDQSSCLQA